MLGKREEMLGKWDKMLKLSENKCLVVLRANDHRKVSERHTKGHK